MCTESRYIEVQTGTGRRCRTKYLWTLCLNKLTSVEVPYILSIPDPSDHPAPSHLPYRVPDGPWVLRLPCCLTWICRAYYLSVLHLTMWRVRKRKWVRKEERGVKGKREKRKEKREKCDAYSSIWCSRFLPWSHLATLPTVPQPYRIILSSLPNLK